MRKYNKNIALILVIICFFGCLFSGCGKSDSETENNEPEINTEICMLFGNTKNVMPSGTNLFSKELGTVIENGADFSVIVLDGDPKIGMESTLKIEKKLTIDVNSDGYIREQIRAAQNTMPEIPEIDIIAGLKAAAGKLSESSADNKELLIYSSGISTTGALNFTENPSFVYDDPVTVAKSLERDIDKIDLSGMNIIWLGINEVSGEQKKLSSFAACNLEEIWRQILISCGADENKIEFKSYTRETEKIEKEKEYDYNLDERLTINDDLNVTPVKFRDDIEFDARVKFDDNSNNFINEGAAQKSIEEFAEKIKKYGLVDEKIYIVGLSAAADTDDNCLERSQLRADKVKNILSDCELKEENLVAIGIGKYKVGDWREDDSDSPSGENRKVFILIADSESGRQFIKDWNAFKVND